MQAAFLELQRGMSSMPDASAPVADLSLRISRLEHRLQQQGARALLLWRACLQDRVEEADDADAARLGALLAPPDALASDHAVPSLPHADAYAALVALLRSEARMRQAQPGSAAISGAVQEGARLLDAAAMAWRELIATAPELGPAAGRRLHAMCETSAHALMWLRAVDAAQRHLSPEQGAPWLGRADAVAARLAARLALQLAELRSLGDMASALEPGVD